MKIKAISLNYRDLMVVRGIYAPNLGRPLPWLWEATEKVELGTTVTFLPYRHPFVAL